MKIGLFGGSFNPPHKGHLRAAEVFLSEAKLDRLIIMPAGIPPHKELSPGADDSDRLNMAQLNFSALDKAEVSSYEIDCGGKSYTADTLKALSECFPDDELFLYIGDDMLNMFRKWHEYREIFKLTTIFVMRRRESVPGLTEECESLVSEGARILLSHAEPEEISSTEIRKKLSEGCCPEGLSESVYDYILRNGLYR